MKILIICDFNRSCDWESLNETLARGKVVLCFQSRTQRLATVAASTVMSVKGAGLIFAKAPTKDVSVCWSLPCVQVDFTIGTYLLTYMEGTRYISCFPRSIFLLLLIYGCGDHDFIGIAPNHLTLTFLIKRTVNVISIRFLTTILIQNYPPSLTL